MYSAISLAEQIFNTLPDWQAMRQLLTKISIAYAAENRFDVFEFVWIGEVRGQPRPRWQTIATNLANHSRSDVVPYWHAGLFAMAREDCQPVLARNLRKLAKGEVSEVPEVFSGKSIKRDDYYVGYTKTEEELVVPMIIKKNVVGLINIEAFNTSVIDSKLRAPLQEMAHSLARIIDASEYDQQRREEIEHYVNTIDFAKDFKKRSDQAFLARPFEPTFHSVHAELDRIAEEVGGKIRIVQPDPTTLSTLQDIHAQILECLFGIVDVTGINPNVFIELGMLIGSGKPRLLIRNSDEKRKLPFDTRTINIHYYSVLTKVGVSYASILRSPSRTKFVSYSQGGLSTDARCNTSGQFDIGSVDQDLIRRPLLQ